MAHTKESIQSLLDRNPAAVERALVVLFGHQTTDEKRDRDAKYWNQMGFDAFRAPACSMYAVWVEAGLKKGKRLGSCIMNPAHKAKALKYVRRYWRQLIAAAEARDARDAAEERAAIQEEGCSSVHG
jgi:L-alanine-DL-glutamate epimerase-like enolase superfamily enzyme